MHSAASVDNVVFTVLNVFNFLNVFLHLWSRWYRIRRNCHNLEIGYPGPLSRRPSQGVQWVQVHPQGEKQLIEPEVSCE